MSRSNDHSPDVERRVGASNEDKNVVLKMHDSAYELGNAKWDGKSHLGAIAIANGWLEGGKDGKGPIVEVNLDKDPSTHKVVRTFKFPTLYAGKELIMPASSKLAELDKKAFEYWNKKYPLTSSKEADNNHKKEPETGKHPKEETKPREPKQPQDHKQPAKGKSDSKSGSSESKLPKPSEKHEGKDTKQSKPAENKDKTAEASAARKDLEKQFKEKTKELEKLATELRNKVGDGTKEHQGTENVLRKSIDIANYYAGQWGISRNSDNWLIKTVANVACKENSPVYLMEQFAERTKELSKLKNEIATFDQKHLKDQNLNDSHDKVVAQLDTVSSTALKDKKEHEDKQKEGVEAAANTASFLVAGGLAATGVGAPAAIGAAGGTKALVKGFVDGQYFTPGQKAEDVAAHVLLDTGTGAINGALALIGMRAAAMATGKTGQLIVGKGAVNPFTVGTYTAALNTAGLSTKQIIAGRAAQVIFNYGAAGAVPVGLESLGKELWESGADLATGKDPHFPERMQNVAAQTLTAWGTSAIAGPAMHGAFKGTFKVAGAAKSGLGKAGDLFKAPPGEATPDLRQDITRNAFKRSMEKQAAQQAQTQEVKAQEPKAQEAKQTQQTTDSQSQQNSQAASDSKAPLQSQSQPDAPKQLTDTKQHARQSQNPTDSKQQPSQSTESTRHAKPEAKAENTQQGDNQHSNTQQQQIPSEAKAQDKQAPGADNSQQTSVAQTTESMHNPKPQTSDDSLSQAADAEQHHKQTSNVPVQVETEVHGELAKKSEVQTQTEISPIEQPAPEHPANQSQASQPPVPEKDLQKGSLEKSAPVDLENSSELNSAPPEAPTKRVSSRERRAAEKLEKKSKATEQTPVQPVEKTISVDDLFPTKTNEKATSAKFPDSETLVRERYKNQTFKTSQQVKVGTEPTEGISLKPSADDLKAAQERGQTKTEKTTSTETVIKPAVEPVIEPAVEQVTKPIHQAPEVNSTQEPVNKPAKAIEAEGKVTQNELTPEQILELEKFTPENYNIRNNEPYQQLLVAADNLKQTPHTRPSDDQLNKVVDDIFGAKQKSTLPKEPSPAQEKWLQEKSLERKARSGNDYTSASSNKPSQSNNSNAKTNKPIESSGPVRNDDELPINIDHTDPYYQMAKEAEKVAAQSKPAVVESPVAPAESPVVAVETTIAAPNSELLVRAKSVIEGDEDLTDLANRLFAKNAKVEDIAKKLWQRENLKEVGLDAKELVPVVSELKAKYTAEIQAGAGTKSPVAEKPAAAEPIKKADNQTKPLSVDEAEALRVKQLEDFASKGNVKVHTGEKDLDFENLAKEDKLFEAQRLKELQEQKELAIQEEINERSIRQKKVDEVEAKNDPVLPGRDKQGPDLNRQISNAVASARDPQGEPPALGGRNFTTRDGVPNRTKIATDENGNPKTSRPYERQTGRGQSAPNETYRDGAPRVTERFEKLAGPINTTTVGDATIHTYEKAIPFETPHIKGDNVKSVTIRENGFTVLSNEEGITGIHRPAPRGNVADAASDVVKAPDALAQEFPHLTNTDVPNWVQGRTDWAYKQANSAPPVKINIDQNGKLRTITYSEPVKITEGPFKGLEGDEIRINGNKWELLNSKIPVGTRAKQYTYSPDPRLNNRYMISESCDSGGGKGVRDLIPEDLRNQSRQKPYPEPVPPPVPPPIPPAQGPSRRPSGRNHI